ncbi:MAG: hypothetical protein AB7E36_06665 [Salinivirgaceae bacterium]
MNKKQSNHLSSYLAVAFVLTKYEEKVGLVPALEAAVAKFTMLLNELQEVRQIQEGRITGTALQKQQEEDEMIEATLRVAAGIYVFAREQGNLELKQKVKLSDTKLRKLGNSALLSRCTQIYNLAVELNSEALVLFGILPETLVDFKKEIDDFALLVGKPRSGIVARSAATQRLQQLFKEIGELLREEIDKLMLVLKGQEPAFFNEYKAARIIVDLRGPSEKEEAVSDEESQT